MRKGLPPSGGSPYSGCRIRTDDLLGMNQPGCLFPNPQASFLPLVTDPVNTLEGNRTPNLPAA